jgi:hypothetical protein
MNELAKRKGISFLSKNYLGMNILHLWKCSMGHEWHARPGNINYIPHGKCPKCSNKKRVSIDDLNKQIIAKGGELLTDKIINVKSYIKIRCNQKHEWETQVNSIRGGKWCPVCGGSFPLNIEILREKAMKRGGKLLSDKNTNANDWYDWQCSEGHVWKAKYSNIYSGNWCKQCNSSLGERICRLFFERLFGADFPSSFPKWLRLNNKVKLELDGFNEKLKIAFEHQGEQHFNTKTQFIKSDAKLNERIQYDKIKRELCKINGVILIEVPEINNKIKPRELKDFIKAECLKAQIIIPANFDDIELDYNEVYKTPEWKLKLKKQIEIAEAKGGRCLSSIYKSNNIKLRYCCERGHEWNATPQKISLGRWCPECAKKNRAKKLRHTIEMMKNIAAEKHGKCLSDIYINSQSKLKWQCNNNHIWESRPASIINGSWCNICSIKMTTINKKIDKLNHIKEVAKLKLGVCLSEEYFNYSKKLKFKCENNHEFYEVPANIKKGNWCNLCKKDKNQISLFN